MIGFIRLGLFLLVGLSILYVLIRIYARSLARERLEKRWDAGRGRGSRTHFIELGMKKYERSMRRRLLLGVYIVPPLVIAALVYWLNFA